MDFFLSPQKATKIVLHSLKSLWFLQVSNLTHDAGRGQKQWSWKHAHLFNFLFYFLHHVVLFAIISPPSSRVSLLWRRNEATVRRCYGGSTWTQHPGDGWPLFRGKRQFKTPTYSRFGRGERTHRMADACAQFWFAQISVWLFKKKTRDSEETNIAGIFCARSGIGYA